VVKETRNRPALPVPDEQEVLSYWFPPGIHHADAETYREQWLRWFRGRAGGGAGDHRTVRRRAGAGESGRARLLGGHAARAARAHHRPRPVLPQRLQGHAAGLRPGPRRPAARSRGHRGRDVPRHGGRREPVLRDAPRPRRGFRTPGADGSCGSLRRRGVGPRATSPQPRNGGTG